MTSYFNTEFFIQNRQRLRELFSGTAPIVLTAHGLMQRNNDMAFPFRQDSNFWYLTGINEPDIILVMDKDKEYLIVPERDEVRQVFDGSVVNDALTVRSGIQTVFGSKTGWKQLSTRVKKTKHIATLAAPKSYAQHFDFYTNPARAALHARLKEYNPSIELLDLREQFRRMRSVKQPAEIKAIQASVDLTVNTLRKLPKSLGRMAHEYEVDAYLTSAFRNKGATHGYAPIVAGGQNACTLHYENNAHPLDSDQLLLIDAGAEVEFYAADITRTFALKPPTRRQRAVHQAVLETQDFGLSLLKPGNTIHDNEKLVEQFIGEKLRELGLIKTIEHETVRQYYPHALSHYLGLDVHDAGDYERPLEPGMVLTVEPGIYISEEGIGIRIEDDVLITKSGNKVLSHTLPRMLE